MGIVVANPEVPGSAETPEKEVPEPFAADIEAAIAKRRAATFCESVDCEGIAKSSTDETADNAAEVAVRALEENYPGRSAEVSDRAAVAEGGCSGKFAEVDCKAAVAEEGSPGWRTRSPNLCYEVSTCG